MDEQKEEYYIAYSGQMGRILYVDDKTYKVCEKYLPNFFNICKIIFTHNLEDSAGWCKDQKNMKTKSQAGLVGAFIGIMVAVIVGVGVAIPVIQDTITNASLTGTTLTIVNLLPLMIGLVLFVAVAALITLGRR